MVRHRRLVVLAWLVAAVAGAFGGAHLARLVSNTFTVPGTESDRVAQVLATRFHDRSDGNFLVVVRFSDPVAATRLPTALRRAAAAVPTGIASPLEPAGAHVAVASIATRLPLAVAKRYTPAVRRQLAGLLGVRTYVTGAAPMQHDLDPILAADLHHGEYELALPVALLVLLATLGISWIVSLPLLFAGATIEVSLGAVYLIAQHLAVASYVSNLVELIGLGLAVDYSLLIVFRFREELRRAPDTDAAVVETMRTAGRTVLFSAASVALGLALLLVIPLPFVRSLGLGGLLIPLSSIVATLTLLPALLATYGRRGTARHRLPLPRMRRPRLARLVLARPLATLVLASAFLLAVAAPVFWLRLTPGSLASIPRFPESVRGFRVLAGQGGAGALYPTQILVDGGRAGGASSPAVLAATRRLASELRLDGEVARIGPFQPVADHGRYRELVVVGRHAYGAPPELRFVRRLRGTLVPAALFPAGTSALVGGGPAQGRDFLTRAYSYFPWLVGAVLLFTYLLLVRAFRSLLLPLKAIVLNVLSVAASYGVLVVVFQWGLGHAVLGLYSGGQIDGWIPIFLFAILFGLSMDYEVFLVSRVREAWESGLDTERAVGAGLDRSGPVVSAAAVIMIAAFSGFVAGRIGDLQQFGLGLAAAVFIDATVIRLLLVPSLMHVLGRGNWWLPSWAARPLGLEPHQWSAPATTRLTRTPIRSISTSTVSPSRR
jgi:RND superfamily putative drug exporter